MNGEATMDGSTGFTRGGADGRMMTRAKGETPGASRQMATLRAALRKSQEDTAAARALALAACDAAQTLELRVREVDHRAKNSLQLAAAMLLMQAQASDDGRVQHQLRTAVSRLNNLAEVHAALYRVDDHESLVMRPWLERVCDGFQWNPHLELRISAPDLAWPVDLATPVGLFVGEAVANAVKHAFRSGSEGRIEARLEPLGGELWRLSVSDDGDGMPEHAGGGLGMKLLNVFARQLQSELIIDVGLYESGLCARVDFRGPTDGGVCLL